MRKCPFCAEEIQDKAIICRHCKSVVMPPSPMQFSTMTDEELRRIAEDKPAEYTDEEITSIGEELAKRVRSRMHDLQEHNPELNPTTPQPIQSSIVKKTNFAKSKILFLTSIVVITIVVLFFVFQPKHHEPAFSYKVNKLSENDSLLYIIQIVTDPGIEISYENQRPRSDEHGEASIKVPSKNLPFSTTNVSLTLIGDDFNLARDVQIDNRPPSFSFPTTVTDFQNTNDGKWLFNVDFSCPADYSIFVNNYTLTTISPGTIRLVFDASDLDPFSPQSPVRRFNLLVRANDGRSWQGYIDINFQFPSLNITMIFRGNNVVQTGQSQVSFTGSTLTAYGGVSPRFLVEKLFVNDKEVSLKTNGSFEARVTGLTFGSNNIVARAEGKHHTSILHSVNAYREMTKSEKLAQYKEKSIGLTYAMLSKNPDRYKGQYIAYRGKIFSIQEDANGTVMQVHVTPQGYGYWDDQIMVYFKGQTDFVKDNLIWVCGTVRGSYTYTSVAGWNITVPLIDAEYLDEYEGEYLPHGF